MSIDCQHPECRARYECSHWRYEKPFGHYNLRHLPTVIGKTWISSTGVVVFTTDMKRSAHKVYIRDTQTQTPNPR